MYQAAYEKSRELTKQITDVLNKAIAIVDPLVATVNERVIHINKTIQDLSNLHATRLGDMQTRFSAHPAKQCDPVEQLSANGTRASQAKDKQLRMSSAKMTETLSPMMKELIEGCAPKRAEHTKQDERQ